MQVTESPSKLEIDETSLPEASVQALEAFKQWCKDNRNESLPHRGRNYAALVTLDRLRDDYNLDQSAHKTDTGRQVKHQYHSHVSDILDQFGEKRNPTSEAGRTSRGSTRAVDDLLNKLAETNLGDLNREDRYAALTHMMNHCVWVESQYQER